MSKVVACIMYGLGGAALDPAGGEAAIVAKLKSMGIDTAGSPYACSDVQAISQVLLGKWDKRIVGGDSLGANNGPYVAQLVRQHVGLDYLFGFQPSLYGMHQPVPRNVVEARCIYNPDAVETLGLGAYAWVRETGNRRTLLHITTAYDMHPGDNDVAMQNLVFADIERVMK